MPSSNAPVIVSNAMEAASCMECRQPMEARERRRGQARKFCSPKCRLENHLRRRRQSIAENKCPHCGKRLL